MLKLKDLTPTHALETLGLRRDEVRIADVLVPMIVAFGVGLGVGAGAALIFAPQTGRELRGEIQASAVKLEKTVRKAIPIHRRAGDNGVVDDGTDDAHNGTERFNVG